MILQSGNWHYNRPVGCLMVKQYLLWTRACSTLVVLSDGGAAAEFWLITERNFSSSLVLSVFPAPLSPLRMDIQREVNMMSWYIPLEKKVKLNSLYRGTILQSKVWSHNLIDKVQLFIFTWWGHTGCHASSTGSGNTHWPQRRCEEAAPPSGVCCTSRLRCHHTALLSVCMDLPLPGSNLC